MNSPKFHAFSDSNSVGYLHPENQDSYIIDEKNTLAAVADGVGGYSGAKEASSLAVEYLSRTASKIENEATLLNCIKEIHCEIQGLAKKLNLQNMGTTIAVVKVLGHNQVILGNVGDSPVFLLRDRDLREVSEDDSHRTIDPTSMFGITQYLGLKCELDIHTKMMNYRQGDALLLCSDGVTDNFLNFDGGRTNLSSLTKSGNAEAIVKRAIELRIKPDDMTAVVVMF